MTINNYNISIDSLEIKDIIDVNLLQTFQDNFARSMDIASVTVDRNGNPVTKPSFYTSFCRDFIHSNPIGDKRCAEFHEKCGEISAKTGKPYIYICHAGLVDFAAPILINGKHIGTILGGQVLTQKYDKTTFKKAVEDLHIDKSEFMSAVKKIHVISLQRVRVIAELLYMFTNEFSKKSYEALVLKNNSQSLKNEVFKINLLLEKSKTDNEFMIKQFSVLSHELRTPLNIIYSTVQLLESCYRENTNMHEAKMFFKYYDIMKQNCYRLTKLISNIVDMNKIDLGLVNANLVNNNIVNIVENITLSVVGYAELKNISVVFDTEVEEKTILCDQDKIERIMLNLLSNSIKFTKPGGSINVNIYDGENYITISVKDSGIGIPQNMLDKIFNTFTRVDNSLTRNVEGCGIGLAIVKSLVEMHGGKVTVMSKVDIGSEFVVKLPTNVDTGKGNINNYSSKLEDDNVKIEFSDLNL